MAKPIGIRKYINTIRGIELPAPRSKVLTDFVEYVVNAHSWYKASSVQNQDVSMVAFNFYVSKDHIVEASGSSNERVYEQFQHLNYGVPGSLFDVKSTIPREIYDAGLAIVPGTYASELSKRILVTRVRNVLEAVKFYRERYEK